MSQVGSDIVQAASLHAVKPGGVVYGGSTLDAPYESPLEAREHVWIGVSETIEPGDVLAFDPAAPGSARRATTVQAGSIVGVAATPSRRRNDGTPETKLADARYVLVKVDAAYGAIRPGDLLAVSPTPGHAMLALDPTAPGIVGRALEPHDEGTGLISVLVTIR